MIEQQSNWSKFVSLTWYDGAIEFLFKFVAKTSEPLLALGLVISAADVLTRGRLMAGNLMLIDAWAWTQAVAIESSGGVVLVYALQSFKQKDKIKAWLYVVLAALLSIVGGMMLYSQLLSNATGAADAFAVGSNWQVQTLVILRVVVSVGYVVMCRTKHIRFTDLTTETVTVSPETAPAISDETVQLILSKLAKLDALEQALTQPQVTIIAEPETPIALLDTVETPTETEGDEPALEAQISALLAVNSDLSSREVATIVGKPHSTVYRQLAKVKQLKQST